jgi:hypothetical protein
MGAMPVSPEMGGGAGRMTGMQAVDALGPTGGNVNQASSVMAGQTPGMMDVMMDRLGIGTPRGMDAATQQKLLEGMLKMMTSQQQGGQQRGQGGPSPMMPMQAGGGAVQPLRQAQRPLPRYPWSPRNAPAGLLYDGG